MEIIDYQNANHVIVKFENGGYITNTTYEKFINGGVGNPYDITVYGKGYIGVGKYYTKSNNKYTKQYKTWNSMLQRCYDDKILEKFPTYAECEVCVEWLNFQNFAKWFDENYYEIENLTMELDKDILVKGNKLYSPETCIFVPNSINLMFSKCKRGNLPVGVTYDKFYKKYIARCTRFDKRVYLGRFKNIQDAFNAYKNYKEQFIKEVADKYKNQIPNKLYEALYKYTVDIDD